MTRTIIRWGAALVLLTVAEGCTFGPRETTFAPAQRPQGIHATLTLGADQESQLVEGELLAVREEGLLVRAAQQLALVPFEHIADGRFREKSALRIGAGRVPSEGKREQLRLMSRFPQGLGGAVLERLLEAHGQEELIIR